MRPEKTGAGVSNRDTCLCGQMFALHNEKFCITASKINEDSVRKFPTIEKLGLKMTDGYALRPGVMVIFPEDLERILQSAQVVYGSGFKYTDEVEWSTCQLKTDTMSGLIIGIEPLKKKTKAEAALELLSEITNEGFHLPNNADIIVQAKRILEMKDEV